jgi:ankyrin repeat protein
MRKDNHTRTPVEVAAEMGNEIINALLAAGATVDIFEVESAPALALEHGYTEVASWLLDLGE